jgi:hypothetical protein
MKKKGKKRKIKEKGKINKKKEKMVVIFSLHKNITTSLINITNNYFQFSYILLSRINQKINHKKIIKINHKK